MICTILTKDGGIKHFDSHDPVLVAPHMPLNILLSAPPQPTQQMKVRLRVCLRCGVTYLDGIERDFEKGTGEAKAPTTTDVH